MKRRDNCIIDDAVCCMLLPAVNEKGHKTLPLFSILTINLSRKSRLFEIYALPASSTLPIESTWEQRATDGIKKGSKNGGMLCLSISVSKAIWDFSSHHDEYWFIGWWNEPPIQNIGTLTRHRNGSVINWMFMLMKTSEAKIDRERGRDARSRPISHVSLCLQPAFGLKRILSPSSCPPNRLAKLVIKSLSLVYI